MADSIKKQRPLWYTALVLLVVGVLWVGQQMGLLDTGEPADNDTRTVPTAPSAETPAPNSGPTQARRRPSTDDEPAQPTSTLPSTRRYDAGQAPALFRDGRSDVITTVTGEVVHVLPLDNFGSRHQNFLLEVDPDTELTLKISHNIDLAPMVPLERGDFVTVHGEYEWNDRGGVIHWTHHDPRNRREGGWIEHEGERYE